MTKAFLRFVLWQFEVSQTQLQSETKQQGDAYEYVIYDLSRLIKTRKDCDKHTAWASSLLLVLD